MSPLLSPNTQAILLLTAPLMVGRSETSSETLRPSEYKRVAGRLIQIDRLPSDLIGPDAEELFPDLEETIEIDRLQRLLARGFQLSQAVERWQARSIWVAGVTDDSYPKRIRQRLNEHAPPVIYGCGNTGLLDSGGLAVVGSREVDEQLVEFTLAVGKLAAEANQTLVSGGARGIDQASMRGALEAGGKAVGVMNGHCRNVMAGDFGGGTRLVVAVLEQALRAYDANTHLLAWSLPVDADGASLLDGVSGREFAVFKGAQLTFYNAATRAVLRQFDLGQPIQAVQQLDNIHTLAVSAGGRLLIVDGADGQVKASSDFLGSDLAAHNQLATKATNGQWFVGAVSSAGAFRFRIAIDQLFANGFDG